MGNGEMTYDHWKTTEPEPDESVRGLPRDDYTEGFAHGYTSALTDAELTLAALVKTITAYGLDTDIVHIDDAIEAIRALAPKARERT